MLVEKLTNFSYPQGSTGAYDGVSLGKVPVDNIDLPSLRKELFPAPKVIKEPSLTIDQMCTAALSRLRYSINANCEWEKIQFQKSFEKAKKDLETTHYSAHNATNYLSNSRQSYAVAIDNKSEFNYYYDKNNFNEIDYDVSSWLNKATNGFLYFVITYSVFSIIYEIFFRK